MAKRRKKTYTKSRKRRVSGVGKVDAGKMLTDVAGVAVGAALAGFAVKQFLATQSDTIKGIAPIAAGIAIPMVMKSNLGEAVGNGMIAVGVLKFLGKAGLAGTDDYTIPVNVGELDEMGALDDISGIDDMPMAGTDEISVLAGMEDLGY